MVSEYRPKGPPVQTLIATTTDLKWWQAVKRWRTRTTRWRTTEHWTYTLPDGQRIDIPEGFEFDGASIPRLLWPLISPNGQFWVPGLIHDWAYRYGKLHVLESPDTLVELTTHTTRKAFDELFYDVALAENGLRVLTWLAWGSLRLFGWIAWQKRRKEQAESGQVAPPLVSVS